MPTNDHLLIYQMGKVGSSTIYGTLSSYCRNKNIPLHQIYFLKKERLEKIKDNHIRKNLPVPDHVSRSHYIADLFFDKQYEKRWKIISLAREPVSRLLSGIFQNLNSHYPDLYDKETAGINLVKANEFVINYFNNFSEETDYTTTWFDKEFKVATGVDIYKHPYNKKEGYSYLKTPKADILILTMEKLPKNFKQSINNFFPDLSFRKLLPRNIAKQKYYSKYYLRLIKKTHFPNKICKRIYNTKYIHHFYEDQQVKKFIRKWSA